MELLERVIAGGGQLLRVENLELPGARGGGREAAAFFLTFDVGRVLVSVEPKSGGLAFLYLEVGDDPPGERVRCDEDEPWWRLLGSPLARATEDLERGVVALQFRADTDNPRVVTFRPVDALVRVALEPTQ